MWISIVRTSSIAILLWTVLLGILYPLSMTGLAQLIFPKQANGSLIYRDHKIIGSTLIGQTFQNDLYFHSRPSAAGNGYDPMSSGGSNLSQTSKIWMDTIQSRIAAAQKENAHPNMPVPVDLITASGSGLDPDESVAAAYYQIKRVAHARHMPDAKIKQLIDQHTHHPFGFLGETTVNVLELNMALDRI